MHHTLLILVALTAVTVTMAQGEPNPYVRTDEPSIGPAPEPVMEQIFWVELRHDPATAIEVSAPEGVELIDRTRPGQGNGYTRLYFRSDRGIDGGEIVLQPAGGDEMRVPLKIRTYREDIELQVQEIPGMQPDQRKRGRSWYTEEMLETARRNIEQNPEIDDFLDSETRYDGMTDEEIFQSLPSWNVPRQCYSNWPCPHCGEDIFRHSGFYPWKATTAKPWKLTCPDCGREFPTNDWAAGDMTSGEYPDDGWGFPLTGTERDDHAGWIAYYNHHQLWRRVGSELRELSLRYLLRGDEDAAHRAGVLLARIAYVYPGMDMMWQQVKEGYLRRGRLLVDGNWERGEILVPACKAYDAIWDYMGRDEKLARFLREKDPAIEEPDDVRALIDTYMVQVFGYDWLRRELSGGNMGARERDLAEMAVCANMGPVTDRWIEELFTHAYSSGLNKGGFDDETLINTMTREGPVWISALGYAYGYLPSKSDMAEVLARVRSDQWGARCDLYDAGMYPKLRAEFDAWPNMIVAGQFGPSYGDSGAPPGARYPRGIVANLKTPYMRAYRRWPTDTIARALHRAGSPSIELFEPNVWDRVVEHAERVGPAPPLESRVMDGVGFVFLESRPHAAKLEERAGLALRYGYGRGHHHEDNLNVELFAHGLDLTPELGYPCWAHPMGNTSSVAHHITGMIDYKPQYTGAIAHGRLEGFSRGDGVSFADVSSDPGGFEADFYRRAIALVDAPGGNVYVLDILRMAGGTTRTWCFHGPAYDDFRSSLHFAETGEDAIQLERMGRGMASNIINPQAARDDGPVAADWRHQESDVRLRVDVLGEAGRRYITAECAKPDIPPIRYLFAEDEAADGVSEFVSIWQPYREGEGAFIQRIERLPVEGEAEGLYPPIAVRVTLSGGRTDTFIYSLDPDADLRVGQIEFSGSFGYWSEVDGRPRAAHLYDGTRLAKGDRALTLDEPRFEANVTAAELRENVLTLDRPVAADVAGALAYLQGGQHCTAYHVAEIVDSDTIRLDLNSIRFRSKIEGFADDGSHLVSELPPSIEVARGFPPGHYDGAVITSEDLSARYRVDHIEGEKVFADRPFDPADFTDTDGDGRVTFRIYDHGAGDRLTVRRSASATWE